jgi:collagen triple helix repeat protein
MRKALWALTAVVAVLALSATASGTVRTVITGGQIAPHSITSKHMVDHTLQAHDLSAGLLKSLQAKTGAKGQAGAVGAKGETGAAGAKGETGAKGDTGMTGATGDKGDKGEKGEPGPQGPPGITGLETDGPYPGRPDPENNLAGDQGAQSTHLWAHDGTLQTSWVMCAPGKVALGGGFGQDDVQTDQLVIVSSSPVQVENGKTYFDDPSVYKPIAGDPAGSFVPNGWIVQGYNKSGQDLIVRPWVICAKVNR